MKAGRVVRATREEWVALRRVLRKGRAIASEAGDPRAANRAYGYGERVASVVVLGSQRGEDPIDETFSIDELNQIEAVLSVLYYVLEGYGREKGEDPKRIAAEGATIRDWQKRFARVRVPEYPVRS